MRNIYDVRDYDSRFVMLLVAIAAAALLFVGCGQDPLKGITDPEPSPSPSATPVPTPDAKCTPDIGIVQATKKGGSVRIYSWAQGAEVQLHATLYNIEGNVIKPDCGVGLRTDWSLNGDAFCQALGSIETPDIITVCEGAGTLYADATRGGEEASAAFRIFSTEAAAENYERLLSNGVAESEAYGLSKGIK